MKILTIRTDKPEAEIGLYDDQKLISSYEWTAHYKLAETIHIKIKELLDKNKMDWDDINGIVAYQGPGSFTGLRIGIGVSNALAGGLDAPIIGAGKSSWVKDGIEKLINGENQSIVFPEYGAEVHITQPKN
jgi:tRNA threonylcarbamoyladenosine biosynthesis protein TsaB